MGIESTKELSRADAVKEIERRLDKIMAEINGLTDSELALLLYGTRDSIFVNYVVGNGSSSEIDALESIHW